MSINTHKGIQPSAVKIGRRLTEGCEKIPIGKQRRSVRLSLLWEKFSPVNFPKDHWLRKTLSTSELTALAALEPNPLEPATAPHLNGILKPAKKSQMAIGKISPSTSRRKAAVNFPRITRRKNFSRPWAQNLSPQNFSPPEPLPIYVSSLFFGTIFYAPPIFQRSKPQSGVARKS